MQYTVQELSVTLSASEEVWSSTSGAVDKLEHWCHANQDLVTTNPGHQWSAVIILEINKSKNVIWISFC